LLSIIGRHKGDVFEVSEVIDVTFDEHLDSALFTYTPDPGEIVRPADRIVERLTLPAAVARVPFTVLVPTCVPDPEHAQLEVCYHPPSLKSVREYLMLSYRGDSFGSLWLYESRTVDPDLEKLEWEKVDRPGLQMRVSDPGADGSRIVALEKQGTHVTVWSDLDRELLIDLAASLVPALAQ
jgi:hypothetical protein